MRDKEGLKGRGCVQERRGSERQAKATMEVARWERARATREAGQPFQAPSACCSGRTSCRSSLWSSARGGEEDKKWGGGGGCGQRHSSRLTGRLRGQKKKIKNLEIRKANFEVFVFTLSLTDSDRGGYRGGRNAQSAAILRVTSPTPSHKQGAVVPLRLNWF